MAKRQEHRQLPESPRHDDLRGHLLELYARLISVPVPGDQLIGRFLRLRPLRGAGGFLSSTAYAMLRKRYRTLQLYQWADRQEALFDWPEPGEVPPVLKPGEEAALAMYRWMREDLRAPVPKAEGLTLRAWEIFRGRELPAGNFDLPEPGNARPVLRDFAERIEKDRELRGAPEPVRDSARLSIPVDFLERWKARFGDDDARTLAESLGETAPLDLRVNTIKTTREECLGRLKEFEPAPTRLSPDGIRLGKKANVFRTDAFQDGFFEVQDEGSQMIGLALDPHPNWRVLDACAGGGGKTLHLGALMMGKGEVFAHDISEERLDPQKKRLRRAGLGNVRMLKPGAAESMAPYDAVLIDAPCLGLGTLRRNPDFAWRGPLRNRLEEISRFQEACLRAYAPLVKPGGILVYATCSFEPEETTGVMHLLSEPEMDFRPDPVRPVLDRYGCAGLVPGEDHTLTLLPSKHGTDGFFIARFRRGL